MLTADQIRKSFLDFFASKGHTVIASDSLVPKDDPTVLFTTAGMQQFKRQFLGHIEGYTRATTSQKCLRTDDLDQVGKTAFHHTFFEMLGNFSFGDYFKQEAIQWAWEFLTKIVKISPDKLWVSVHKDDSEAEKIWLTTIRIPKERLVRLGDKSNFWPSNARENGPNGPCGPCSEIFFDYGVNPDCPKKEQCDPDCSCGRFSEVWNLVFTQFNRKDGGVLEPLANKNIDTGMGLERLTAVLQGKTNNYDTDLFMPIRQSIRKDICQNTIMLAPRDELVIADHIRAIVFAINDGVIPSNKERGSVVKRLINDSTNLVVSAGADEPTIYKLVPAVVEVFRSQYPEMTAKKNDLMSLIQKTEEAFIQVRKERLPEFMTRIKDAQTASQRGEMYFLYRDTYGLPLPTISATAIACGVSESQNRDALQIFHKLMKDQQDRARAASKMAGDVFVDTALDLGTHKTEFVGYTHLTAKAKILKLFIENKPVHEASAGDTVKVVLDKTPFYAQAGGQVGDSGHLLTGKARIDITDTQKINDIYIHSGKVTEGLVKVHDLVHAEVEPKRRLSIMRNHTATHILQAGLRRILGHHVQQQGSLVAEDRLRFDFTHPQALTPQQKAQIEDFVNTAIQKNDHVEKREMPIEEAKKLGALSFFAEKYGARVRVVSISDYSKEFCGGTHLNSTGEIEKFRVSSEGAVAQGIRRIEAKTADFASQFEEEQKSEQQQKALREQERQKQKEEDRLRFEAIKSSLDEMIKNAQTVGTTTVFTENFADVSIDDLRKISDLVKQKVPSVAVTIGTSNLTSCYLFSSVTDDLISQSGVRANDIIKEVAPLIGGTGGGKPQMAQAGSKDGRNLAHALAKAKELIITKLKG